jgi:hypothetical protein
MAPHTWLVTLWFAAPSVAAGGVGGVGDRAHAALIALVGSAGAAPACGTRSNLDEIGRENEVGEVWGVPHVCGSPTRSNHLERDERTEVDDESRNDGGVRPSSSTPQRGINMTKNMKNTRVEKRTSRPSAALAYRLRSSRVHGSGLFATRRIPKDTQIIEYVGEHISHEEADRRHADNAPDDGHTFLFTIDAKTVIDAGVGGNLSRFINHSCDPSCEVVVDDGRPFVVSLRTIQAGEELAYDYNLTRSPDDPPEIEQVFGCRCGAPSCRGTMLAPPKKTKAKASATKTKAKAKASASLTKARARGR